MPKVRVVTQQTVPGPNLGEGFTASIAQRQIVPGAGEAYYESLVLSLVGTVAVANVPIETFLGLLSPFTFLANETRINLRALDMFALSAAWYEYAPKPIEGGVGNKDRVFGIRVPLWIKTKSGENYAYSATRVAQTNISAETLAASLLYDNAAPPGSRGGRIDAREIPVTGPAATGITQLTNKIPKLGNLLGLLFFNPSPPTLASDTSAIQSISIDAGTTTIIKANWADLQAPAAWDYDMTRGNTTEMVKRNILTAYGFLDLRDEPIDLKAADVAVSVDQEVASSAFRLIPVIEVPQ